MRYFSMFSGIGGFEIPLQELGWECIGYSEIDSYAIQIYEKHFPGHQNFGDATKLDTADLPDFDLLVAGFPCQAFSIAGKRRGFDDTRGTLFFEIARVLRDKRPRYLLLENVKGLLSHDSGKTFQTILGVLTDLGYQIEWQVLNSKNHGVPQNRERVFIVGNLGGEPRPQVFPFDGDDGEADGVNRTKNRTEQPQAFRVRGVDGVSSTLQGEAGGTGAKTGLYMIDEIVDSLKQQGLEPTEKGWDSLDELQSEERIAKTVRSGGRKSPHGSKQNWDSYKVGGRIRRLTPTECERLQGFPDGWTAEGVEGEISDTQRYKTLGNAVTVNVVRAIMEHLEEGKDE